MRLQYTLICEKKNAKFISLNIFEISIRNVEIVQMCTYSFHFDR